MYKQISVSLAVLLASTLFLFASSAEAQNPEKSENQKIVKVDSRLLFLPENGCVPDSETAAKLAEAIWLPVYGDQILKEKPFKAQLYNDSIWVVQGSLPDKNTLGGVAYIEIVKRDGRIIGITHGK